MALTGAVAALIAYLASALAVGGHRVLGFDVPAAVFGLALAPGLVAVAAGRRPQSRRPKLFDRPAVMVVPLMIVIAVVSTSGGETPAGTRRWAVGLLVVAGAVATTWWPQAVALTGTVGAGAIGLLRPGGSPAEPLAALVVSLIAAAVALVAAGNLRATSFAPLGGRPAPASPRRTAAQVGAVLAVIGLTCALVAALASPSRSPRPRPEQLVFDPNNPLTAYNSLDPGAAGAGVQPGRDELVFRVEADRAEPWRAQTFDRFADGRWSWSVPPGPGQLPARPRAQVVVGPDVYDADGGERLRQRVTLATFANVAVGAPRLAFVGSGRPNFFTIGPVVFLSGLPGSSYTAVSVVAGASEQELRASDGAPYPEGGDRYTAADGLSARARALAADITAPAPTAFDKVRALERWLAANVILDDEVAALAPGTDVVDAVLFGQRRGSPERLATTLAMLVRSLGIPARLATGFQPGERSVFGGDFEVRARHRLAWVEVAFPGLGWQRFDATGRIAEAVAADSFWARLRRFLARIWPLLVLVLAVAVAVVVRRLVRRRRLRRAAPWAARAFERLQRAGGRRGRPRAPAETPREYASALAGADVLADERLHRVGEVVTAAAWSGRAPADDDVRFADQVLDEVVAASRRRRRRTSEPAS